MPLECCFSFCGLRRLVRNNSIFVKSNCGELIELQKRAVRAEIRRKEERYQKIYHNGIEHALSHEHLKVKNEFLKTTLKLI